MSADELKDYIIENDNIVQILEALECHDIKEYTDEYRAALPQGTNKTAVCVKKGNLSSVIRNAEGNKAGDIFTLVMNIKGCTFGQANKFIHKTLGIPYKYTKTSKDEITKVDPLQVFKKVQKRRHYLDVGNIKTYDDSFLSEYVQLPHISWIREGILPFACERFNIGYSYNRKRIVIPERLWSGTDDEYIGISGRTVIDNYEMFDIPKYFKLSDTYPKGFNVYGLNENYKTIQESGYVVVTEAQKSVLKRYSRKDGTCVAIGNCEITEQQVKILISLNVEIILCFDEGISIEHVRKECEKFYHIRPISYMFDRWKLMEVGSKDSPADMPNKVYNFMRDHRVKYDESEHKKYLEDIQQHTTNN